MDRLLILLLAALTGCGRAPEPEAARSAATSASVPARPLPADTTPALEIRFLDVGQGDAVLLRSGGRAALIDTGPSDRVVRRLRELGVDSLSLLLASHNHADHIGGADAVLDSMPVRFYLDNGSPAATRIQERVLRRVEDHGVTYLAAEPRTLSLGSARLRVIPAPPAPGDEQNNQSVVVVVEQGGFRALLTGDSEVEEIGALLREVDLPDVDVLKAAHHGSRNGVTPAWLARTRPEVVVISLAADNSYGHPHPAALRYYCAGDRQVYRTDRQGEVRVRVRADGGYVVMPERAARLLPDGSPDTCRSAEAGRAERKRPGGSR